MYLAPSTQSNTPVCVALAELCLLGQDKNLPFWDLLGHRCGRLVS